MAEEIRTRKPRHDAGFWSAFALTALLMAVFLIGLLAATATHSSPADLWEALGKEEIQYSIRLSLLTCTAAAALSLLVAVPIGYLLSRGRFRGRTLLDALFDIPIVLPPMVTGLCLLIFFQTAPVRWLESAAGTRITYTVTAVVVAQFVIGSAFAIRMMRQTFDYLSPRPEQVALTLGATRWQAFRTVTLPAAARGMAGAFSVAWARSLGEFGPILVFAGATRLRTEVLPTTVWLELSVGNLEAAIAVSLLMVLMAMAVLVVLRLTAEK